MLTAPQDLNVEELSRALGESWGIEGAEVSHAPVGHGSHNWWVAAPDGGRWFLKAYRRGADSSFFDATNRTAAALHAAGLDFVAAPIPDRRGRLRPVVSDRWELALLPFIEGRNTNFELPAERAAVAGVVGRLHAIRQVPEGTLRWSPGYLQPELRALLTAGLDHPWATGPYGEPARSLLTRHRPGLERLLALSDDLVERLAGSGEAPVITHGEPHGGNTMRDASGAVHLVDCDAMMVAAYRATAGEVGIRSFVMELFRAEWHLMEICRYATRFSRPHAEDEDTAGAWRGLRNYVQVGRNWPELLG